MAGEGDVTHFVRFREYNDHEGESWNWWLQRDGNAEELATLFALLQSFRASSTYDLWYELHLGDVEGESDVDKLCEYADDGGRYNPAHNKVTGTFTCPTPEPDVDVDELFYKGGIRAYFR